jgi:hypothetical protein
MSSIRTLISRAACLALAATAFCFIPSPAQAQDGPLSFNGAIIPIGSDGRVCIRVDMPPGSVGQVHLIGDTTGYFSFP